MNKHVVMIIANSPKPSYFMWFADYALKENIKLSQIYLCDNKNEIPAEELNKKKVSVYWFKFDYKKNKIVQYLIIFIKLILLFRKIKPDVVQTNLFDDSLPALFAARICHIKKRIITKQDTGYHIKYTPQYIKFDKFNNRNATDIICVSEETKELILKYERPDKNKMRLIHHGVDEDFFTRYNEESINAIKNKFNLHHKKVIGIISRYVESKGYFQIIEAAKDIVNIFPDIVFFCVGWGPQKELMEKLIKEKNLDKHFILTGKIEYELIPSVFQCFNIFLHAAEYEPFGFVIAEAMFSKIPVISTKVGAAKDILVHIESAYLLDSNKPENIINAIEYMLNCNNQLLINNAYMLAKKYYSKEVMWLKYKALFLSE